MRLSIPFVILCGVALSMAQDATLNSNSEETEILHLENLVGTEKTGLRIETNSIGVMANTTASETGTTIGIYGTGVGSTSLNQGVIAIGNGTGYAISYNYGVNASGQGGDGSTDYGVYGEASGGGASYNYGIYGTLGEWGESSTNYAGYFNGDVGMAGVCDPCSISDEMFKKNIRPLEGSLSKIMTLKPKAYEMKTEEFKDRINLGTGTRFGLVAQDVQSIFPEIVHDAAAPPHMTKEELKRKVKKDPLKYKSLNYTQLIPVLIQAIQEQQAEIEALKAGQGK